MPVLPPLAWIVVLGLAAYRATRVVTTDTISEGFRGRLYRFAWDDDRPVQVGDHWEASPRASWRTWAWELLHCDWCLGFWVSAAAYAAWRWGAEPGRTIVAVFAVAGVQGPLAAFVNRASEPPEEREP